MDPVSVFRALYDSKCIKFGQHDLKSGLVAPYHINLRRLPLHPKLMEAVVGQVVERFLSPQALGSIMSQLRRQQQQQQQLDCNSGHLASDKLKSSGHLHHHHHHHKSYSTIGHESDADSQLEDELETCSEEGCEEHSAPFRPIISGVPCGAVPLAAAVAYKAQLPYLLDRREGGDQQSLVDDFLADSSGTEADEPEPEPSRPASVVLIEDVVCSGESTLEAVESLEKLGLKVEFVICIVNREENGINLLLERRGIRVFSLYNMIAILRVLEATGRITPEVFVNTRQWIAGNQFKSIGASAALSAKKCSARSPPAAHKTQPEMSVLTN